MVREEGSVTRFVAGVNDPRINQVRNVISIAAMNARSIKADEIMSQVKSVVADTSRHLAGRQNAPVQSEKTA